MWEFYLAGSEMAFRYDKLMVFQLQLTRRVGTLPIARNYMFKTEQAAELPLRDVTRRRAI